MNETDAFFTQTIVGAAFSVPLGQRLTKEQVAQQGLTVDFETGETRLTQAWRDWWALGHGADSAGKPRLWPRGVRRWLERHALWLALLGLTSLLASVVVWRTMFWI